ncbi:MAG: hypothetical protein JXR73_22030 [Candidatus Omnitrophica bacterium]|nr:hypothetical protein [Candidatus Omnitrophota bacterium]
MDLKLDKQSVELIESGESTVQDVIKRVSEQLKKKNRVISEILVNGRAIGGMNDPQLAEMNVRECESLALTSDEPRKLAHKVLYQIAEYMPRIHDALVETSNKIQSRQENEGMKLLEEIMTTWSVIYQGFRNSLIVTGLNLDQVSVDNKTLIDVNELIHQKLEIVADLVQAQSYLELSDVLEYELAPLMPLLEEGIYKLIREFEKGASG